MSVAGLRRGLPTSLTLVTPSVLSTDLCSGMRYLLEESLKPSQSGRADVLLLTDQSTIRPAPQRLGFALGAAVFLRCRFGWTSFLPSGTIISGSTLCCQTNYGTVGKSEERRVRAEC